MKPILEAILGHWYWHFFQQNHWRFMERTATNQPPGDDINSWDLQRILAEIDEHFTAALAQKRRPATDTDRVIRQAADQGHDARHDASHPVRLPGPRGAELLHGGRTGRSRGQDAFVLQADSPIFAPIARVPRVEHRVPRHDLAHDQGDFACSRS